MRPTIFVIDDEPFMLRLIDASLRKGGYEIGAYRDAELALVAALLQPPSLFVLDLVMPGIDGIETLRRIKEEPQLSTVPVILLTSKGRQLSRNEIEETGASLYLTKPFSPMELLNEARRLIRGR